MARMSPDLPTPVTTTTAQLIAAAVAAGSGTYAPWRTARPGNLAAFIGTSITLGSDDLVTPARGDCWPVYASIFSGQRIRYVRNAGVAGDTLVSMLARFDTSVTPYSPNVVIIEGGTNDDGVTSIANIQSSITGLVAKVRAINAVPVLCTSPPTLLTAPTADRRVLNIQRNQWVRLYAAAQGLCLLDFYTLLVDPATGDFTAGLGAGDGKHPNAAGFAAMATYANTVLAPLLPINAPVLCQDDVDESNAVYKGCFGGYSGSTLPTGWVDNAGIPGGSVLSYTTDAAVKGQMVTITSTATAGARQLSFACASAAATLNAGVGAGVTSISITSNPYTRATLFIGSGATAEVAKVSSVTGGGSAWTVTLTRATRYAHSAAEPVIVNGTTGDVMRMTGIVTSDGGVQLTAKILTTGGSASGSLPMSNLTRPITRGTFLADYTIPGTSTTEVMAQLQAGAGTGVVSFGQVGLFNATRLGWPL